MSFSVTIERSKLNQSMYKKLKKYIMNKRKQQVEQKEQDDHYKRIKLEKAKRKRQAEIDNETMETLQQEYTVAVKRLEDLRAKKKNLFTRFKQLANDESILKDKQKSEISSHQFSASGLTRTFPIQTIQEQMITSPSVASLPTNMLGYNQNKIEVKSDNNPIITNHSQIPISVNDIETALRYAGVSPGLLEALCKNNSSQRILNQPSHINSSPMGMINQNSNSNASLNNPLNNQCINENTIAALFASLNNSNLSTLVASGLLQVDLGAANNDNNTTINSNQLINPLLAQLQQLEKYGGNLNTTSVAALSQQLESLRQAQNNPQRILESFKQLSNNNSNCFDSYNSSQVNGNAAAFSNLVNNSVVGTSLLPPAPTSYRGSITTGQSAQNIQLQHVYQQQQQQQQHQQQQQQQQQQQLLLAAAAKIVNNAVNHGSPVSQHQSSHLGVLSQHHNLNLPTTANVLPMGSNPVRQSVQHDSNSLFSSNLDQHSFFSRNINPTVSNAQQNAAANALAAFNTQAQLVHHLNAHAASQNYRQKLPPSTHNVQHTYF